jgi:flagellar basal-body rod protein FlgF/flagellar basal-body rod protein FlgG
MENNLLIGLSRQMALQRELDVVANNLANLNTTGFKGDGNIFREYLMPAARSDWFAPPDRRMSYVVDRASWIDFSKGSIQPTGNPLDLAIDGDAFLVVQTPRGERYTRNGALQINGQGQLVTADGHAVLGDNGPITFQPTDRQIAINREGTITVVEGQNVNESQRGRLRLVGFAQPGRLRKDGANLFAAPDGLAPQPAPTAGVQQGMIEKSNVRAVAEMTRMIEITRTYTTVATLLQQQGDLRRTAVERLADVPA